MGSLLACTAYLLDVHVLQSEWPSRAHPRLCPQPQTPHLEEDLKEVLRSEAGIELIIEDDMRPEKQKRKPGLRRSPIKKVRKSLALDIVDEDGKMMSSTSPKTLSLVRG